MIDSMIGHHGAAYSGTYVNNSKTAHKRAYKAPAPRKCDGTILLRAPGASVSERVPGPAWLEGATGAKKPAKSSPKIHPLGYQLPKGRKDDGTMLVRFGRDSAPVRIPTPDNFRVVHFDRMERRPLPTYGPKYDDAIAEASREAPLERIPCRPACTCEPCSARRFAERMAAYDAEQAEAITAAEGRRVRATRALDAFPAGYVGADLTAAFAEYDAAGAELNALMDSAMSSPVAA